ncbi:hypothetical protein ACQVP2_07420 [Methylobacterium aquaticum]|uniref:hypothetical protein n=1 Tax=Methylobacterium aquaticum TaxID=270351 RepID=UPI003D17AEDF
MISHQMRRLLALAQLVTTEVVRVSQEGDIEGVAARVCDRMLPVLRAEPATPEEIRDVAVIVGFMLDARTWANRMASSSRRLDELEDLVNKFPASISHLAPAGRGA